MTAQRQRLAPVAATAVAILAATLIAAQPAQAAQATGLSTLNAHTCALTAAGGVRCWGWNKYGQLGDGTRTTRDTPVNVTGLASGVTQIAAGGFHTCALLASGGVKCWGSNGTGELGDGTTARRLAPIDVAGLGSGVVQIVAGYQHTCALTAASGVKCWGWNEYGQLGDNSTTSRLIPTDVSGLTSGVTRITGGGYYTCALTAAGGAKCWGSNSSGQLGDDSTTNRLVPADVSGLTSGVTQITGGGFHTCALVSAIVKCWGSNEYGQVGDDSTIDRLIPADVSGLTSGVTRITGGGFHTCAVVGGGAKCWGSNDFHQLGDNVFWSEDHHTPIDVFGLKAGVADVAAGYSHSCALTTSGKVACWGNNDKGKLGDNTTWRRQAPVFVQGFGGIATTVTLRSSTSRAAMGRTVTYTTRIKPRPGGGRVRFTDRGISIRGCGAVRVVQGIARCSKHYNKPGTHRIVAHYLGTPVYKASESPRLVQVVT